MNDQEFTEIISREPFPWPLLLASLCVGILIVILHAGTCGIRERRAGRSLGKLRRRIFAAAILLLFVGSGVSIWQLQGMLGQVLSWLQESKIPAASAHGSEIIIVSVRHIVFLYTVLLSAVVTISAAGFALCHWLRPESKWETNNPSLSQNAEYHSG